MGKLRDQGAVETIPTVSRKTKTILQKRGRLIAIHMPANLWPDRQALAINQIVTAMALISTTNVAT